MQIHRKYRLMDEDLGAGGGEPEDKPGVWPEDWRKMYAGEDESKLGKLSKYTSPNAAFDAMISAQQKISSGEYKAATPFPMDGKDEDKASWRKDHGIPETHDKYEFGDFKPPEADKEKTDNFLKAAHDMNLSPDQMNKIMKSNYDTDKDSAEALATQDKDKARETQDSLRAEWGTEFRENINKIESLMASFGGADMYGFVHDARGKDGTLLFSNPDFVKFMANMAQELNPHTTHVPAGGDQKKGIQQRIGEIKTLMKDDHSKYWKGPESQAIQSEYIQLLEAQEKLEKRG